MLSDSWKSASEDPQKHITKKYDKHEIVRLLKQFPRPNYPSYQRFEATFQ